MTARLPTEVILDRLTPYLGPHTAKNAVKTFSQRALGLPPENVSLSHVPELLAALKPALTTLLGQAACDHLLESLKRELKP
jgi:hypothetical protein